MSDDVRGVAEVAIDAAMMNETDGEFPMQTLRFEDREWLEREYVRDDNGRLVPRQDYEDRVEFREALRQHNSPDRPGRVQSLLQSLLLGGIIWGAAMLIT